MPALREALAAPLPVIRHARLADSEAAAQAIAQCLPAGAPSATVLDVFDHVAATRPPYRPVENYRERIAALVDRRAPELGLRERMALVNAPINLRDLRVADGVGHYLRAYRSALTVNVRSALAASGLLAHLEQTMEDQRRGRPLRDGADTLPPLESLHKLLSLYVWLAFRNPVAWPDMEDACAIKLQCEAAMTWCLEEMAAQGRSVQPRGQRLPYDRVRTKETGWGDRVADRAGLRRSPGGGWESTGRREVRTG
jgi:ATP-dependent RNA helicase SUPV3L1/SUV3